MTLHSCVDWWVYVAMLAAMIATGIGFGTGDMPVLFGASAVSIACSTVLYLHGEKADRE